MRSLTWLRAALLGLAGCIVITAEPIVKIEESDVTYRGIVKGAVEDFHNIKFAHDTSGARRFAPPEPYTPPKGSVIDATVSGPACPQSKAALPPYFDETPDQSEDCLNLRVTRPVGTTASDKLPVVVHLVGGGVIKASTYDTHFDPANLITHSISSHKPIIHVVLNYRVTIYGFARLPLLREQKSLNVGMRDQRAGFQWVKDNIAAFGGDPDCITSFGLSSGGTFSTLHLMAYGGEKGVPFTQAWTMSGPPGTALNMSSDATETHTRAVAERLECDAGQSDEDLLECLRKVPMDKLTEVAMEYSVANHPPGGLFTFIPSVDGDFLPDRQSTLYKAGKFVQNIPIVFGWTQDDGATNAGPAPLFATEDDIRTPIRSFAHALTDDDYAQLFALYPASDFAPDVRNYEARKAEADPAAPVHWFRASRILRDLLFACSAVDFGFEVWRRSRAADPAFPGVWHYQLNQSMMTPLLHAAGMPYVAGAAHGSDLDYLYNNLFPRAQMADADRQLSDYLLASFLAFAYSGNPSSVDGPQSWPESFSEPQGLGQSCCSETSSPGQVHIQLIGGVQGVGAGPLARENDDAAQMAVGSIPQHAMFDDTQFGEMESGSRQGILSESERRRLLERCAFINGLAEKLGH